ncbi:holin [Hathewaya massiliensis]|uniref:holin n=1 Tax=Hathewaya massiliensis TaxID=1964382 RepID=UPI00115C3038|nr:holin [Hathewaya massiliensis]
MDFTSLGVLTGLVMALAEFFKSIGVKPKLIPVLNLIIGCIFGVLFMGTGTKEGLMYGLVIGLTAGGFYSTGKNVIENFK